jgi:hypothetical protein
MRSREGILLAANLLALPLPAQASPGSPVTSTVPCGITLVARRANGSADPAGTFTIVVRGISGNPVPFSDIVFNFAGCPDVSICSVQPGPGVAAACGAGQRMIQATTDQQGALTLTLVGGVLGRSNSASSGCMKIYAGGILLTDGVNKPVVQVSALDETGGDGLTPADLSLWLSDYFDPSYQPRSDFDYGSACSPKVSPTDLSLWLTSYFGGYVEGCNSGGGTLCP